MGLLKVQSDTKSFKKKNGKGARLTAKITSYLSPEEYHTLEGKAMDMGLKLAPYIRYLLKSGGYLS